MKYILATNSLSTYRAGAPANTPGLGPGQGIITASFGSQTNFRVNFNKALELPRNCQMCIISSTVTDANAPKLHYVHVPDLPLKGALGNMNKGGTPPLLGAIISNATSYGVKNWVDLENPSPLVITGLTIRIVNQDGIESSGLSNATEILIGYRGRDNVVNVS